MAYRITDKMLEFVTTDINRITGAPNSPYKLRRAKNGSLVTNDGTYVISHAYGGVELQRMSKGGGATDVFRSGHIPKRELYGMICAMRDALEGVRNGSIKIKRARK